MTGLLLLLGGLSARLMVDPSATRAMTRRVVMTSLAGLGMLGAGLATRGNGFLGMTTEFAVAVVFAASFMLSERRRAKGLRLIAGTAAIVLVLLQTGGSHAAAEPGMLPVISHLLHYLAVVGWAGCALHLATLSFFGETDEEALVTKVMPAYTKLSIASLAVAALAGGLLAFVHIHNADALTTTRYGFAYQAKLVFAGLLLVSVALQRRHFSLAEGHVQEANALRRAAKWSRRVLRLDALLLVGLIVTSVGLAVRAPPGLAPFLNPQSWSLMADDTPITVALQPVSGSLSRARLEIQASSAERPLAEGTRAVLSMQRSDGAAGLNDIEALPIGPSTFLAEVVVAMPGTWALEMHFVGPDGELRHASHVVTLPGPPLARDMRAYLSLRTIAYTPANLVSFIVGVLLVAAGIWAYRLSGHGRAPAWLAVSGLGGVALAGLLVLSVSFVKTYPSSFWRNPVPYTVSSIRDGDNLYREHCAECHGIAGRGDGPWAIDERGSIPDLSSPHMDTHTDGEIYWWLKHGIPSLDMPGYDGVLDDNQNWSVINFLRSLRHGMPPEQ